ncbi:MAG: AbrB/MazE/SpoVT family DNA-binding domain-containing protein [Candidatus Methanofastidiosia archaeon]
MSDSVVRVGVRGRITIPKEIRDSENIHFKTYFKIHNFGGVLVLEKVEKQDENQRSLDEFL